MKNFTLYNSWLKNKRDESFSFQSNSSLSNIFLKKSWFDNYTTFKFSNISSRSLVLLVFLNLIFSWRSLRSLFGLPVNGQRTWSNSNNALKINTTLINFKINQLKLIYVNLKNLNLLKQLIQVEYLNLIFKKFYNKDWIFLSKKNKITTKKFKVVKLKSFNYKKIFDFIGFERGFLKKKFLSN